MKRRRMKTPNKIILFSASLLLLGCHKEKESAQTPKPNVEGENLILQQKAAQPASVATENATASEETVLRLNGRVVWNDDMTVRIFAPFAGRVIQIAADSGQQVKAGAALATIAICGEGSSGIDPSFHLKTPIDGTVVEKNINTGQKVCPDQMSANDPQLATPLFTITDPRQMWVYLDVTEEALPMIQEGQPLTVRSPACPNQIFHGKVDLITDGMDPVTRTIKIRGVVDNADRLLKPETYVSIELAEQLKPGIQISDCPGFVKRGEHFVFVQEMPGPVALRHLTAGAERSSRVILLDSLKQGQTAVTDASLLLEQIEASLSGA
jgi:cobalt-zinc-cadmium efflux system membrane fusion protein